MLATFVDRVIYAIYAMRGHMQEHSWIMGSGQATCRHCGCVVDVEPVNAEGDWNSRTVFCSETRSTAGSNHAALIATIDKIADDSGKLTRA